MEDLTIREADAHTVAELRDSLRKFGHNLTANALLDLCPVEAGVHKAPCMFRKDAQAYIDHWNANHARKCKWTVAEVANSLDSFEAALDAEMSKDAPCPLT